MKLKRTWHFATFCDVVSFKFLNEQKYCTVLSCTININEIGININYGIQVDDLITGNTQYPFNDVGVEPNIGFFSPQIIH